MAAASCVLIFLLLLCNGSNGQTAPAMFIFGDSLSDVGNNNFNLLSTYKANYFPNGIDYPGRIPTGRFCNGRLVLDIMAPLLGFPVPSASRSPTTTGSALLKGVNYASAGCGILDETSNNARGCNPLSAQLKDHTSTVQKLGAQLGADGAADFLRRSMYFVAMGSNDFLGNYVKNTNSASPADFISRLASALANDIKALYDQNARHMVIIGLGPLGCIPSQRLRATDGSCYADLNTWSQITNAAFQQLVLDMGAQFPDALITFANPFNVASDFAQNPSKYGLAVVNEACCGGGRLRAQTACLPGSVVCTNRNDHMFWDAYHPSEAANQFIINEFLSSTTSVTPLSIKQVASGVR